MSFWGPSRQRSDRFDTDLLVKALLEKYAAEERHVFKETDGPVLVTPGEWEYAAQYLSADEENPWMNGIFYVCPVPSHDNTTGESERHEDLAEYRSQLQLKTVTLKHEFIKVDDRIFAMPSAYEIKNYPHLQAAGAQGEFSWLIENDKPQPTAWGVKKTTLNRGSGFTGEQMGVAQFATTLSVGENYPFVIRPQHNRIHYYHVQWRAPGPRLDSVTGFGYAIDYYLQAISLIRMVAKLHAKRIIHRDLKPKNIMLWQTQKDPFGVAVVDNDPEYLHQFKGSDDQLYSKRLYGTPGYIAPESENSLSMVNFNECAFEFPHMYSTKSDVFALGMTLLNTFGITQERQWAFTKYTTDNTKAPRFRSLPASRVKLLRPLEDLILTMVKSDPDNRPELEGLLSDIIVAMHRTFTDEALAQGKVRLTLEKCPSAIVESAREILTQEGIAFSLPKSSEEPSKEPTAELDDQEQSEASNDEELIPQAMQGILPMYKHRCLEPYDPLRVDPMNELVGMMRKCRLS